LLSEKQIVTGAGESQQPGRNKLFRQLFGWRPRSKWQAALFALTFAVLGTAIILFSLADSVDLSTSTSASDIIVQYSLPHKPMPVSTTNLATPMTPPFTLYGNGLLVCGHDSSMPFMSNTSMAGMAASTPGSPTSTILSQAQIQSLVQQISNTGFFTLDKEYYKFPVIENQDMMRVSLLSGDHYVLYYNDVPAPAAYTQTVSILQNLCQGVTTPYQPATATLRVLKDANPQGQSVTPSNTITAAAQATVQSSLANADTQYNKVKSAPSTNPVSTTAPGEADQTVSGSAATALSQQLNNKVRQFVQQNGTTYEVSVDKPLPQASNPLHVDYSSIRKQQALSGLGAKIKNLVDPKAYAASSIPVRYVLLLPSDGGSTAESGAAQSLGQSVHDWYCGQVGSCYGYQGLTVMRGSQTQAYYMTCHGSDSCQGDPLSAVLDNVAEKDSGTIYRTDVDTVVVTGWPTGELSLNVCGYGFVGANLAAVDLYEPNVTSGAPTFCQPGHDLAHETGHTFGLNHTGDGTLMDGPPYAQYAPFCDIADSQEPTCTLDSGQAATLRGETQFFAPAGPHWYPWDSLGGATYSAPAAVSWGSGRIDLVVRGTDNVIDHKAYQGAWYPWDSLGGATYSATAVSSWGSGRLDVFARATDNTIAHKAYQGAWYPWDSLGGATYSAPAAVSWGSGRIDVFVRGTDNAVYHKWYQSGSGWSGWQNLGGVTYDAPAVSSWGAGRLDVFVRGTDNAIYHKWFQNGSWSGWLSLGGVTYSAPSAVSWGPNRIDVLVRGTDNNVYDKAWAATYWAAWNPISVPNTTYDAPAVTSWGSGRLDVFVRGTDNVLYHTAYQ
jgi:hypothetical protein